MLTIDDIRAGDETGRFFDVYKSGAIKYNAEGRQIFGKVFSENGIDIDSVATYYQHCDLTDRFARRLLEVQFKLDEHPENADKVNLLWAFVSGASDYRAQKERFKRRQERGIRLVHSRKED